MTNIHLVFPEIFLSLSIMFLLILGVFKKESSKIVQNISLLVLLIITVITFNETLGINETTLFNESIIIDYMSSLMKIITLIAAFFVLAISSKRFIFFASTTEDGTETFNSRFNSFCFFTFTLMPDI